MTLDRKLVKEACLELWNECHEEIKELGYDLGEKYAIIQGPEGISIVATISPDYSSEMVEVFRKIIPMEFEYKGEKIPVIISPSLDSLFGR